MKNIFFVLLLSVGCIAMAIPCHPGSVDETVPSDPGAMAIDFHWQKANLCERGYSPQIILQGVPAGTVKFKVRLKDLNMPSYNHGGGEIENDGTGIIKAKAIKNYRGPCPPLGTTHNYRFTVLALDAAGKTLATAEKIVPCNRAQMN